MLLLELGSEDHFLDQFEGPQHVLLEAGELKHEMQLLAAPHSVEHVEPGSVIRQKSSQFVVPVGMGRDDAIQSILPESEGGKEFGVDCVESEDQPVEIDIFLDADVELLIFFGLG